MFDVVIVAAARTAIGAFQGSLSSVPAPELGAIVIRRLLDRSGLAAEQIDEVLLGQVLTAGSGQNPARQTAIRAGLAHAADVGGGAQAAADGEGHENLAGNGADDVDEGVAGVAGGGDVEEGDFVGALGFVGAGDGDGVAGVAEFDEADAFDDAAAGDVEAGDDALGGHARVPL